jgi:hypothetical protein
MNAKDKKKLSIMKSMIRQMKTDVVVIDPDEYRKLADIKSKEFYEVEKDTERKEEERQRIRQQRLEKCSE